MGLIERATEKIRRRPISMIPARPIPDSRMIGRLPDQNSPVCTVVTFGTDDAGAAAAAGAGAAAGAAGVVAAAVVTAGVALVALPETLTSPTLSPTPPMSPVRRPTLRTPTEALAVGPGADVSQFSRLPGVW